jgi:hypothetical protein
VSIGAGLVLRRPKRRTELPLTIQDFSVASLESNVLSVYAAYKQRMETFGGEPWGFHAFEIELSGASEKIVESRWSLRGGQ